MDWKYVTASKKAPALIESFPIESDNTSIDFESSPVTDFDLIMINKQKL